MRVTIPVSLLFVVAFFAIGGAYLLSIPVPWPGNKAPDLKIYSLQNHIEHRLGAFKGRWLMINFWTSWCPPCREEFPALVRMWDQMKGDDNWIFLWISTAEPDQNSRRFIMDLASQLGQDDTAWVNWPLFHDPEGNVSRRYGVWQYPETFIVSPEGMIVARIVGPQQWDSDEVLQFFKTFSF